MGWPSHIRVGPYQYAVIADVAKLREFEHSQGCCQYGYTDRGTSLIVMDPGDGLPQQRVTLWHEVKHCVIHLFGACGDLDEEAIVARAAAMELAVLRDNPALVVFLLGVDDGDES